MRETLDVNFWPQHARTQKDEAGRQLYDATVPQQVPFQVKSRSATARGWWRTPLIPVALRRQRQADLGEFEVSLFYRVLGQP